MRIYESYKDSGVKWIGEIPSHWEIKRLAMYFAENTTKNTNLKYDHALKFNYGRLIPKNEQGDVSDLAETYRLYTTINEGDIAINCLNLNYDFVSKRIAVAENDGIITSAYLILSPRPTVNSSYFVYLFKAMDSMKLFHGMGTGIRLTLSYKELKRQYIPCPSAREQQAIVGFLKVKLQKN